MPGLSREAWHRAEHFTHRWSAVGRRAAPACFVRGGSPSLPSPPPGPPPPARLQQAGKAGETAKATMALLFSALRVLLGLFFAVSGVVKLTDRIAGDAHRQLKTQFVQFADVFPLKEFGYKPEPGPYMETVGWIELVGGCLLAFGPQLLQEISNFVLTVIMIGAIYTLLALKEPLAMCVPATVSFSLLLLLNIRGRGNSVKPKSE